MPGSQSLPFLREGRFCAECGEYSARLSFLLFEDGIPHGETGHRWHYIRVALSHCSNCGMGLLERNTHECLRPGESMQRIERRAVWPTEMEKLLAAVEDCRRPYDSRCDCPLHKSLKGSLKTRWTPPFDAKRSQEGRLPRVKVRWSDGLPQWVY